ncbi:MAG: CPBP family intramembrane metalloprotease [Lachnospiraceae bacterium]|nr:CPBP family intramembrane metalloprotease [Lachnospiraceae bacterium]
MELFISKIISSVAEIALFAAIPFFWWLVSARKEQRFAAWIGVKKPAGGMKTALAILIISAAFLLLGGYSLYIVKDIETAASDFSGLGVAALPAILVYAIFNTSFPEEFFFRGFMLKRLSKKFGFAIANTAQALLFGALHAVMFFNLVGTARSILILALTGAIAWFTGYVNEKKADGSIIPGWIIHAIANIFSGACAAFMIF